MSTYITTRIIRGATVHSYVADKTEEEKREIVRGVLRVCAEAKKREKEAEAERKRK